MLKMKIAGFPCPLKDAATNIKNQLYRNSGSSNYQKIMGRKGMLESQYDNDDDDLGQSLLEVTSGDLSDRSSRSYSQTRKGYLAVYVGPQLRRFVIPISFLTMPEFKVLMERAAEEFGCDHDGGLQIPCEVEDFEQILTTCLSKTTKKQHKIIK